MPRAPKTTDQLDPQRIVPADSVFTREYSAGDVSIRLAYPTFMGSDRGKKAAHLEVIDEASGQLIVDMELNPDQLMDLMSGSSTHVSGATLSSKPERLGRRAQTTSTNVFGFDPEVADRAQTVKAEYLAAGWEVVDVRQTNFGRRVAARRWLPAGE